MNCGFSNLDFLKKQLLAGTLKADKRFDDLIAAIGNGVATQFANLCNRKFARLENAQEIFSADRVRFLISRFPLESVSLVELKLSEKAGWQQFDAPPWDLLQTIDLESGIIIFPDRNDVGPDTSQVRITFTGGYWWNTLEPDDESYPQVQPDSAIATPADLLNIWLLQCRHIWVHLDKLGVDVLQSTDEKSLRFPEDFAPTVEKNLGQFTRYNLV